ncbi:MAG: 2,3-bisphosphoglycerate-independent phosphoglycerate mutase, partial [Desulfovibrio sp.]
VELYIDAYLDGRDTPPSSGLGYIRDLDTFLENEGWGRIAMVSGRYWAMDRDKRWDRTHKAYEALTLGRSAVTGFFDDPVQAVQLAYNAGETDEFVKPRVMNTPKGPALATIQDGDGVFFFNFRADRAKQMTQALTFDDFNEFPREKRPKLAGFATMTQYDSSFNVDVAFPPEDVEQTLGQTVSEKGLKQLRIAETEKYAHVTYFLNCGEEEPFQGEERALIPSPREVATYDLKPEMSCPEVVDQLMEHWNSGEFDLIVCNLANLDMVGHTGIIPAAIQACEVVDKKVGLITQAVLDRGGRMLLTADHGNAEEMIDAEGNPQTAHSLNPVPLVLVEMGREGNGGLRNGALCDIAPTVFDLWGMDQPSAMGGASLLGNGASAKEDT